MTAKAHAVTDGLGDPLHFIVSSGNRNNIRLEKELLEGFNLQGKLILADKGYDSDKFVKWAEERHATAMIPSRITAKHPRRMDKDIYNERHLVENLFLNLKHNRRFATRYEKNAFFICLFSGLLSRLLTLTI